MTHVFIVTWELDYEGSTILAVFADKDKAFEFAKSEQANKRYGYINVDSWELKG